MARDSKKRQKALQRKAAKRKQRKAKIRQINPFSGRRLIRQAGSWPLHEILLTEDWDAEGNIVQAVVSRRSEQRQIVAGVFLIDLGCLGVKNAYARPMISAEYKEIIANIKQNQAMMSADLNLVAKIIREGITYARQWGFEPHRDYFQAKPVLGDANPDACHIDIPLGGSEGKPFFISGPYDNVEKILAKLHKNAGPDGYHYLAHMGSPDMFDDDYV